MRKYLAMTVLAAVLLWGSSAFAGEWIKLDCIDMPDCCTITCIKVDLECCGGWSTGPFMVEFLDAKGDVLGTATITDNWCCGDTYAELDKPVDSNLVCSVRFVKPDDDCIVVTWAKLKVYCGDECCGEWYKVFKGDLWCWQPIPPAAPAPEPAPPVIEKPAPAPAPAVEPEPEPEPEPVYIPETKPEPEVIVVPGRG